MWVLAAARCALRAAAPALRPRSQAGPLPRGSVPSRAFNDGETEPEPGERDLDELIRAAKKKLKAMKYRRIQAEFGSRGAPPRTLTTEALEQIRFLKARFPEEWSVSHLAEGFSVSEDVIQRVLRSKFIPSPERRMKQDAKVAAVTLTLSHRKKQPPISLPSALDKSKLVTDQAPLPRLSQGPATLPGLPDGSAREKGPGRMKPTRQRTQTKLTDQGVVKGKTRRENATREGREECREPCDASNMEHLPAGGMTDEELEKLAARGQENQMNIVQRGHEFYDQDGNFLYRINNPKQET